MDLFKGWGILVEMGGLGRDWGRDWRPVYSFLWTLLSFTALKTLFYTRQALAKQIHIPLNNYPHISFLTLLAFSTDYLSIVQLATASWRRGVSDEGIMSLFLSLSILSEPSRWIQDGLDAEQVTRAIIPIYI